MYNNFKKVFASVTAVAVVASQALSAVVYGAAGLNDPEFDSALSWMYENKLTSYNTADAYRPFDTLTREQAAKFYVGFGKALGLKADETKECKFTDAAEFDPTLADSIVESCKLGLFKGSNGKFMATAPMTKAAGLTVLVRAMVGAQDENVEPWWSNYFAKAKELGLTKETDVYAIDREVTRYEIALILYRASGEKTSTDSGSSSDLSDLLSGLIGDDSSSSEDSDSSSSTSSDSSASAGTGVEEKVVEVRKSDVTGDMMEVTLNPDTPTYSRLPKGADGVNIATFDLAAGEKDVEVKSIVLKRVGDGANNGVTAIALYDDYGRVSKSKTFNSSDDTSSIFFTPSLIVKAGEIKKVAVYGTIGTTAGSQFAIQIQSIESETKISSDLPVTANLMEVGTTTASNLMFDSDGSISNPKLGETGKTVAKFKFKNNTTNSEDITVNSITLKEDGSSDEASDMKNFILRCNGTDIAKVSAMTSKYLTFEPKDGLLVKEAKTLNCEVIADIVGGASKTINFIVERDIDIVAQGTKYKGINVSDYASAALSDKSVTGTITIQAGELSLVTEEPSATEFRKNKKDIVLGKIKVTSNAGKQIELQKIQVDLVSQATCSTHTKVSDYMQNVELYDETASVIYDLSSGCADSGSDYQCSDTSLNVAIPETGVKTFVVRADSKNVAVGGCKFNVQLQGYNSTTKPKGYYFVSTQDDKQVTDVTPSSLSFKNMEGKSSTATITVLPMSTTKNAVIGAKGVEVLEFEVAADNSTALKLDQIVVEGLAKVAGTTVTALDNTRVSALYLYKDGSDVALKKVSGSNIASNKATFDSFTVTVDKNAKQKFIVKADLVDDATKATDTLQFGVAGYRLNDDDNDNVYLADDTDSDSDLSDQYPVASSATYRSARVTTIQAAGSLALDVDTTNSAVDKDKNVLGNTTSDFVASYKLTATNEDVKLKDVQIVADESAATAGDFLASVAEVIIYKSDKTTEIKRESVSSTTVSYTNLNYVLKQGSENIFIKVKTRKIGKDEAGRQTGNLKLKFKVTSAEGNDSGKVISTVDHDSTTGGTQTVTNASKSIKVIPVRVSAISFVDSYSGTSRATKLSNGVSNVLGIIAVTTDSSTNTKATDGGSLKTKLVNLTVNLEDGTKGGAGSTPTITSLKLTRIGGGDSNGETTAFAAATSSNVTFTMTNLTSDDNLIENGTTIYYKVEGTPTLDAAVAGNESVRINLRNLDAGSVVYTNDSDTTNASTVTALNLGSSEILGTTISD